MAKRADAVTVKFAQPIRFETGAALPIRLESLPPAPLPRRALWLRGGSFALFAVVLALATGYAHSERTVAPVEVAPGLSLSYTAPQSVAVDDDAAIKVSLLNSTTEVMTRTVVALVFADPTLPLAAPDGKTTSAKFENLPPGAIATAAIHFVLEERPTASQLNFTLRATLPDGATHDAQADQVSITPFVSRLKASLLWLASGSGLLTLFVNLFWDRLKRFFAPG